MTTYRTLAIDGVRVFYREAGSVGAPAALLLHGFPTSSHMFRNLIPLLADRFHVVAPDYPGFGFSDAPAPEAFTYSFDHLSDVIERFVDRLGLHDITLYVQDYGSPVGFRLAARRPELIRGIVIQNAIAHVEGISAALAEIRPYWADRARNEPIARNLLTAEITRFQYTEGASRPERLAPEAWTLDQALLDRAGNDRIQLDLLFDYQNNLMRYPEWQAYFGQHQPPALIVWGKNDPFFTVAGAEAYLRDLPDAKLVLLDGGHFALEEHVETIASEIIALAERAGAQEGKAA